MFLPKENMLKDYGLPDQNNKYYENKNSIISLLHIWRQWRLLFSQKVGNVD